MPDSLADLISQILIGMFFLVIGAILSPVIAKHYFAFADRLRHTAHTRNIETLKFEYYETLIFRKDTNQLYLEAFLTISMVTTATLFLLVFTTMFLAISALPFGPGLGLPDWVGTAGIMVFYIGTIFIGGGIASISNKTPNRILRVLGFRKYREQTIQQLSKLSKINIASATAIITELDERAIKDTRFS